MGSGGPISLAEKDANTDKTLWAPLLQERHTVGSSASRMGLSISN